MSSSGTAPPNVMPAVHQEAGRGGRKKPSEIVQEYVLAQTGDQKMVNATMNLIYQQIQQKIGRLVQFGNTVFWFTQKGPGQIDAHIFTQESPKLLVRRIQEAYRWAKTHGFKQVTSTLTDNGIIPLLKTAGLPFTVKQTTINDGKQMIPAYEMTMEVQ